MGCEDDSSWGRERPRAACAGTCSRTRQGEVPGLQLHLCVENPLAALHQDAQRSPRTSGPHSPSSGCTDPSLLLGQHPHPEPPSRSLGV